MTTSRRSEAVVHRVLGAVRFVDPATRRPITAPLRLTPEKRMTLRRNAGGDFVIWRAEDLDNHTGDSSEYTTDEHFEALFEAPPDAPAPGSVPFALTVEDPSGERLPRRFEIRLPRASKIDDDAPALTPDLFVPIEIDLYRSTAARGASSGAALYVFVHDGTGRAGRLPGAVVTVSIEGEEVGRGVTGPLGEALVEVPALASFVASEGEGEVTTSKIDASVRAAVLPALLARDGATGPFRLLRPPDPDSPAFHEAEARDGTAEVTLSAGRASNVEVPIALSP